MTAGGALATVQSIAMGGSVATAVGITATTTVAGAGIAAAFGGEPERLTIEEMEMFIERNLANIYKRARVIQLLQRVLAYYMRQGV